MARMIDDIYGLSPMQAGMLFHRLFAPESRAYCDQFSCRVTGSVDPDRLRRAWQHLVDRHPVLRTSFHWEGVDSPVQVVHAAVSLPWEVFDWRGLTEDEKTARWDAWLAADRARGFQPDEAPLMRAAVAVLSDDGCAFCWSHHHLLLDGWCLNLVLREVFEAYEAFGQGQQPALAPVRPYGDFIKWLQRRDHTEVERYWRDQLRGFTAATPLLAPSGHGQPGTPAQADAVVELSLSIELSDALRALGVRHRLTLSTLMQGAWALLLSRYSASDDVVFGATVSGRPPEIPGVETMLGVFVNTVPVRLPVIGDRSAAAWLAEVQARHVVRESHAALALADIQKLSDVPAGAPLFETNVIVMNYRLDEGLVQGAAGLRISGVRIVDQTDIPLTLQATPGRRLLLEVLYDRSRYEDAAAVRVLGQMEHLLSQFVQALEAPLSEFDIVPPAERALLVDVFNATDAPLDPAVTAIHLWEACAAATPDAVALECGEVRLTFRELDARANRLASGLRVIVPAGQTIGPDALIAVAFRRSERLVAAILAIWKCGAAYVPIDPDYPSERIRQVIETAAPCIVLRDVGTLDADLESAFDAIRFASVEDVEAAAPAGPVEPPARPPAGADLAYVIFTSGSTGQPKGAMVEQVGMVNHFLAKIEDFHLDRDSVVVQNASHCFDISVWQMFSGMLAGGRTLVYTDDLVLNPQRFLERVRADRVTVLEVVPSYLAPLLDQFEGDPRPLPDLRFLLVTGETVKPSLIERWFSLFPSIPVANAYGPTEASDDITHAFMREAPATPTVPVGRPLRNFHVYVVDECLRLCPIGVPGEVCVSGPGVGRGYLRDPERTAAAFLIDPFRRERGVRMYRTGDVGSFTSDGTLLLAGRKDHQVKVRGYRIELGDIEAALTSLDTVGDAVVVERRDTTSGNASLAAYVTVRDPRVLPAEVLDALAARLPEYMIPATCTVLARLPLTPNGKVDRKALPVPEAGARRDGSVFAAPGTLNEVVLAEIWSDVLGVERPGVHDNFFAVGGDSILSMQVVSRASRAGLELTPRDVFQHQTIAELAVAARPSKARRPHTPVTPIGPATLTPPQAQFFEDVTIDRHHYNQSVLLEVPAGFDAAQADRAIGAVVAHHDALRLRFVQVDGAWQQHVAPPHSTQLVESHAHGGLSPIEREAALIEIGGRLQAGLSLEHGPLLRAAYFHWGSDLPGRLLITAHHLAVDGVSWRLLLDDVSTAYNALRADEPIQLAAVPTSYLEWAQERAGVATAYDHARARPSIDLPLDTAYDPALNLVDSTVEVTIALDPDTTHAFMTLGALGRRTGPTELLAAAVARVISGWTGQRRVTFDLERHGRDSQGGLDLSRTVGWFTTTEAVSVELPASTVTPGDANGARSSILLNYHGRVDASASEWRLAAEPHGPDRSPRQSREYLLEINGLVSDGRLRVTIGFSRHLHTHSTIQRLAQQLDQQLVAVVEQARNGSALDRLASEPDVEDVYELSPTQQGLLFHALVEQQSGAYFNQFTCVVHGALDPGLFQEAWQQAMVRHAVLRTSFHWQGLERPVQVVRRGAALPWTIDDWSNLPAGDQDRRWEQQAERDRHVPFDLAAAPLMRAALVRTGEATWRFRWSQHHLLLDGWSASIVLNDVLAAYDALLRGTRHSPPPPPRFHAYIDWLRQQDHQAMAAFWRKELEGFRAPTPLLIGLPEMEGRVLPWHHAEWEVDLPPSLATRLKALAAENHVTVHTLFQGAWALLLARHSGDAEVVFGSVVSGRPPDLEGGDRMVGLFINTVPVRARLDDQACVFDWLRQLQRSHVDREAFGFAPLAEVQRESDVPGGTPLFETILIFENYPMGEAVSGGSQRLRVSDVSAREPNNYAMTLVVTPGDSIGLKIMFDAGRFDRDTIARTAGHLVTILSGVAAAPDCRLGDVPVLTEDERGLIDRWNDTGTGQPDLQTVLSLCQSHAAHTPGHAAIVSDGAVVSYGELIGRVDRRASALAGWLERTADDTAPRVVVMLRRSAQLIEAILAIWKCGAAYVPVDPEYPAARLVAIINSARPALILVGTGDPRAGIVRQAADQLQIPCLLFDDVIPDVPVRLAEALPHRQCAPEDLAYIIYTSGSTGVPKGAMVEHAGCLNHVRSMIEDLNLGPDSVVAQTASQSFDISIWQMLAALVAGGTTAIYPDALVRQPDALAARFTTDGVTAAQFVPSYLNVFIDALDRSGRPALTALTHMVVIGEALTPATIARWFELYPAIPLMNAYGPTEAADSVAHWDFSRPTGEALVPIGRPIRNMSLYVMDHAMRICPVGVKGEICIAGIGVGRGYLFDEPRTRPVFVPDPFTDGRRRMYRTGDIGCYRPDGVLLFFGRRDQQVKIRGHRIELGEIETCLAALDGVSNAAVVMHGLAPAAQLCAYVTGHEGVTLEPAALSHGVSQRLPAYAVPEMIRVLDEMPRLPSGKIDRRALEARPVVSDGPVEVAVPVSPTEEALVHLWRSVLGQSRVGVDQSFFDLGGHSLTAIQMISRLNHEHGTGLGVGDVFQHNTIHQLAALVDAGPRGGREVLVPVPDQDSYETSPAQLRMWLASRTPEGSAAYTMSGAFRLEGRVEVGAMRRAFDAVVQRHESLRTVFTVVGGALRQVVRSQGDSAQIFRCTDLTADPPDEQAINALLEARLLVPCDLASGPVFEAELVRLHETSALLIVRLHHIVGDAASIRIVLREALALYAAESGGDHSQASPLTSLPIQYRDYVAWQRARTGAQDGHRRYWMDTLRGELPRTGFIPDHPEAPASRAPALTAMCLVDAELTAKLRDTARRHGSTLFAVVVASVYALLYRCLHQEDLLIGSTVSRRDHPSLEEQVGCYIDTLALRGRVGGTDTAGDLLARTAGVCRDALGHREYSFDALFDDLGVRVPEGKMPLFDVLVDYRPGHDPGAGDMPVAAGLTIEEFPRPVQFAHYDSMFLVEEAVDGATMTIEVAFSDGRFTPDTVVLMRTRLHTILQWLGEDDARSLSEVELFSVDAPARRRLRIGLNTG